MKNISKKQIILRPIVSEKSLNLYRNLKKCTFEVDRKASKKDIITSFQEMFGIKPESIEVLRIRKQRNVRNRKTYQILTIRKESKKAYISIGENKLDIFENIK